MDSTADRVVTHTAEQKARGCLRWKMSSQTNEEEEAAMPFLGLVGSVRRFCRQQRLWLVESGSIEDMWSSHVSSTFTITNC